MGWFSQIFGGKQTIDATTQLVGTTGNVLDKLFTSKEEKLNYAEIMEKLRQLPAERAHELNLLNAKDPSLWNSGWRPGLGWVAVVSAAMYFIPQYLTATGIWLWSIYEYLGTNPTVIALPVYPASDNGLWQLVTLLVTGQLIRQADKAMGTAKD